jgi:hypothetical protein
MTEVAWSCPVLVEGALWRANQEQLVQERGGRKKKRKAEGVLEGGAMCGVLCLRRCGDRDGIGRYNIIQDNFFSPKFFFSFSRERLVGCMRAAERIQG